MAEKLIAKYDEGRRAVRFPTQPGVGPRRIALDPGRVKLAALWMIVVIVLQGLVLHYFGP